MFPWLLGLWGKRRETKVKQNKTALLKSQWVTVESEEETFILLSAFFNAHTVFEYKAILLSCTWGHLLILSTIITLYRFSFLTSNPWAMDQRLLGRVSAISRRCCSYSTLKAWLPILFWLPRYNLKWLQMDLLASITVGLTTVPQALAYAQVAGLPVQVNLCFLDCEG